MNWIVKIAQVEEEERKQRISVRFNPLSEKINFAGQCKVDNRSGEKKDGWVTFSYNVHEMEISLEQLQEMMGKAVVTMRKRLIEYDNLDKGFSLLKVVAFEESTDE